METLQYYVLGKKNSPLLEKYLEKFYQKLLVDIQNLADSGILTQQIQELLGKQNRDFLLSPDISSLINALNREDNEQYKNIFEREIRFFLQGEDEKLTLNRGENIAGTHIKLTLEDNNPYNTQEAHPEHKLTGGVLGWGEKTPEAWMEIYTKTFALLKQLDEGIYDELNQIIKKIIPLGTARGIHNSASYKECVGHLYMGYTIDSQKPAINNLEAIIHESSHNKLNLLMQFDPIVLNDKTEKYYSAVRPDARHIHGIFLGIHAFAPTIYMLMKAYKAGMLGDDPHRLDKIVLYYIKNKCMQKVLQKHAKLTQLGKEVFDEILYVISLCDTMFLQLKPTKESIIQAKKKQIEHFSQVNSNYPHLEY